MFPLLKRKLIRGCVAHIQAGLGCAADYVAEFVPLYAPFDGRVRTYYGSQGGKWLELTSNTGDSSTSGGQLRCVTAKTFVLTAGKTAFATRSSGAGVSIAGSGKKNPINGGSINHSILPPNFL